MKSPAARHTFAVLVAFAAGATVGALFYTSKRVKEKERLIAVLEEERASFQARVTELEAHSKETIVHVERPDGTQRTRIVRVRDESSREAAAQASAQASRETVKAERIEETETNRRRFGIQAGIRTDRVYFIAADADVLGPLFLAVQGDTRGALGVAMGMRF